MKKIGIIARQQIIVCYKGSPPSDEALRVLDSYFETVMEVDKNYDKLSLIIQLEEQHPEIKGWDFEFDEKKNSLK